MIEVFDNWAIRVDDRCYTIGKHATQKKKNTGEETPVFNVEGYYGTLAGAGNGIRKHMQRDVLEEFEGTLADAILRISELEDKFTEFLSKVEGLQ